MNRLLPPILLLLPAISATASETAPPSASAALGSQLAQLGLGLLLVVGLIFLLGWLLRRVGPMAGQGSQHIRLLANVPLGPRDRLLLVDVGGTQMLLGASPGRINTLHVFEQPVIDPGQAQAAPSEFARKLQALLNKDRPT
ncbi:MAG: flagellar biosynthetic protein FliO [Halopseudomonas yangmingensis]|uniref:Flagellar protein n=1 Tax=Halopseudomonas yangmingensis TaxID=1720063 RepID=A0A1I4U5P2_9GAMM|nr:flagellar biosynthetic protein FliO [Halopseudomonas yangmingensis]SFM84237.1 flagellar protein FliO/FliZ [Halopseudomonas yangmingensis]